MRKLPTPTAAGKSNSQFLPRNGRDAAAVQQWSNEVRLCTISPNGAPGYFAAVVNAELLVQSSRAPFCDAARVLLARGVDSNSWLILRHSGSDIDSLRAKKLTVGEGDDTRRWKALRCREGAPPVLKTPSARPQEPLRVAANGGAA